MDLDQRRLEQGAKIFVAVKKALDNWQYRDRLGLSLSDVPSFTMAYVASEMARDDGDYLGQGTAVREPQEASADDKDNDVIPVVEYKIDEEKLASRLERFLVEYVSARQQPTVQSPTSTKHNGRVPYIALSAGFSITYDEDYDDVNEDDGDDDPEESSEEGDPEPLGGTIADGISSMMDAVFGGAPEETEEDQDVAEDDNDDDEEPSEYEIKRAAYISNRVNSAIKVFGKHGFIHTGKYQVYRNERAFDETGELSLSADDLIDYGGHAADSVVILHNPEENEYLRITVKTAEENENLDIDYIKHLPGFIQGTQRLFTDFVGPGKDRLADLMDELEEEMGDPDEKTYGDDDISFVEAADWFETFDEE